MLDKIHLNNRITFIKGARGVGKTTLFLQFSKLKISKEAKILYVSLDDIYFLSNSLYELAENFEKENDTYLLLDEVHKYPGWSREMKLIYDDFPRLKILASSANRIKYL